MLRSLIKQLCYRRPDTPKPVSDLKDFMLQDESPDIAKVLGPLLHSPSSAAVDLSNYKAAVDRDISTYIKQTLDSPGYSSWSTELKIEAEESLMKKADGM